MPSSIVMDISYYICQQIHFIGWLFVYVQTVSFLH